MTRDEASGIENETVSEGSVREGESLTGSRGMRATPIIESAMQMTITENDDALDAGVEGFK